MAHRGYRFDDYTVDTGRRVLRRNGEVVPLPSRAFDTLAYLIEHRDRCVHKDEIIAAIWNDVVVTDDSLIHAVSALRRALGDGRRQPRFIQTVPRRGYRFVAGVEPIGPPRGESGPSAARVADEHASGDAAVTPLEARGISPGRPERLVGLAAVLAIILAAFVVDWRGPSSGAPAAAGIRLFQPAPEGASIVSGGVLSPDGRRLAFVARDDASGETALWVRTLHTSELRRLDGTDGASKPFWSPDSERIAFFANGSLIALDLGSESTQTVATVFAAGGGSWGADDTILFAEWTGGLYAVPASGDGDVTTIATLDRQADDIAFAWPQFFPDSRRFLYQVVSLDPARSGVYVGDLRTGEHSRLLETTSSATLAPPHHLLHVDNDMLIAEELDPDRLELTGRAIVVARGLSEPTLATDNNPVSASADLLAFQHGLTTQNLTWFSRRGEEIDPLALPTMLFNPRISPDGSRLLGSGSVTKDPGLWLVTLDREEFARLEDDAIGPIWSHDSRRIAFTSRRGLDLIVRSVDSADDRRVLASDDGVKILNDWSPDGRRLVYTRHGASTGLDLWVIDVTTGTTEPLLASAASETQARISPDGEWVAYASDESGVLEVYVARFPELDGKRMVSNGGGGQPQWRADQSELYYLSHDRTIMAVAVADGDPIDFGSLQRLFRASTAGDPGDARDHFASDTDGTRFLIDSAVSENDGQAITVMVNWSSDLHD